MEITPATFTAVDGFNDSMDTIGRRMSVVGRHGILPGSLKKIDVSKTTDSFSVQVNSLEAVSRSGSLFQIAGDSISLQWPHASGRECYIVVHKDGDEEQEINDVPYAKPRFDYVYCQLEDIGPHCIALAKLYLNHETWNVQELYVPPCMTVDADPELFKIVTRCIAVVHSIMNKEVDKASTASQNLLLRVLALELESYNGSESPKDFVLLLRKIATLLAYHHDDIKMPDLPTFNNDDILRSLDPLTEFLSNVDSMSQTVIEKPVSKHPNPSPIVDYYDAETRK